MEDPGAVRRAVRNHASDVVINCAAYTAVDRAETDQDRCFAVNTAAPIVLAEEAQRSGSLLVHYSSDYVFDGQSARPYLETDTPHPLNVYGQSKAAADREIASACSRFVILRSSWVFSSYGSNFVTTIIRLARERDDLRVVSDQVGSPTSARYLAALTTTLVGLHLRAPEKAPRGLFHAVSSGSTSWYEFARAIVEEDAAAHGRLPSRVTRVTSSEFGARARRPAYSVLDTAKLRSDLGITPPDWRSQLSDVLTEI